MPFPFPLETGSGTAISPAGGSSGPSISPWISPSPLSSGVLGGVLSFRRQIDPARDAVEVLNWFPLSRVRYNGAVEVRDSQRKTRGKDQNAHRPGPECSLVDKTSRVNGKGRCAVVALACGLGHRWANRRVGESIKSRLCRWSGIRIQDCPFA